MSFQADIEHIYMPPEDLPATLRHLFKSGCCGIFENESLVGAVPATLKQTNMLADLMESCAVALDDDFTGARTEYFKLRDELCAPLGHVALLKVFKQEVQKRIDAENAPNAKYLKLASAAKPKLHELN